MYSQILDKNRNVFRAVLKLFTDEELRMEHGNWFHQSVPNVTAYPSTASVPTSYYSMRHYNYLCTV